MRFNFIDVFSNETLGLIDLESKYSIAGTNELRLIPSQFFSFVISSSPIQVSSIS